MKKTILATLIIMATLSLALSAEKYYWRYWPFEPAVVYSIKVTNPGNAVCSGEAMTYELDIDKKMAVPVTVYRQLVNSQVITLPESTPPDKPLGRQTVKAFVPTPRGADYGEWFMRWTAKYEVGPEKRIIAVSKNSDKYHVVPCAGDRGPKGDTGKQGPKGDTGGVTIFGK